MEKAKELRELAELFHQMADSTRLGLLVSLLEVRNASVTWRRSHR